MRVSELLTEGVNLRKMQQDIYDFVIAKMDKAGKTHAAFMAKQTDQFWTPQFDQLDKAISRGKSLEEVYEELDYTIEEVSNSIADYFSNAMNFEPGYKPVQLKPITRVSNKEMESLLKKFAPDFVEAELAKIKQEQKVRSDAAHASLPEVVAAVKKYADKGWTRYLKHIKRAIAKNQRPENLYDASKFEVTDFEKIENGQELKQMFREKLSTKEFMIATLESCLDCFDFGSSDPVAKVLSAALSEAEKPGVGFTNKLDKLLKAE